MDEEQAGKLINKIIDERVDLILRSLSVHYEPKPLIHGFDCGIDGFDISNAYCMTRLSDLAYKDHRLFRGELDRSCENYQLRIIEDDHSNTACYVVVTDECIFITFRGTETRNINRQINNIITDTNIIKIDFGEVGRVHRGFKNAIDSVWGEIYKIVEDNYINKTIWITGHSLGGALAVLAGAMLITSDLKDKMQLPYIYTVGQPKVGNSQFSKWFGKKFRNNYFRITQGHDPVVMVPILFRYKHAGSLIYLNEDGTFEVNEKEGNLAKKQFRKIRNYLSITSLKLVAFKLVPFHIDLDYSSLFSDHSMLKYLVNLKEIMSVKNE